MGLTIANKTSPLPIIGDKVTLKIRDLLNPSGSPYNLSGVTKFYCTIKDELSDEDEDAIIQLDSEDEASQFTITYASTGNLDVTLLPANTALLLPDVTYFIDVKAIWSATEIISIVRDTIEFVRQVTRATS